MLVLLLALLPECPAYAQEYISHGLFDRVALYRPPGEAGQFVLFLSGDGGWDKRMDVAARALSSKGAMVAGIDMPRLRTALGKSGGDCVLPDGDLENLSHYLQGYARQSNYRAPLLVGYDSGAAFAYAMQAAADEDTFSGAISLSFCPRVDLGKPLCERAGKHFFEEGEGEVSVLAAVPEMPQPWVVLQRAHENVCPGANVRNFVDRIHGAALSVLPDRDRDNGEKAALPALLASNRELATRYKAALPPPPAKLVDLPLIEMPASGNGDTFAVLLSGDGGWAGLDKQVAASLVAKGIPVVSFDSLRYFWKARDPKGLATDLDRIVRYYAGRWSKKRVLLIGYSQGADVLPFAVNRLPAASRVLIARIVLMGLGQNASFEFHLANWIGKDDGLPILPEVIRLREAETLCLYGQDEKDSLCPEIAAGHVHAQPLAGGHHFDGAYDKLAELILRRSAR
ncbi:AcvB/VirJ family lysyl-phosphatidylglycerol hydrolase [Pseudoxanthomonas sp. UTMC 1351]|uniref:AcvB/VirJ family lysyl-phosphatidylglycerol hydrolase n=1 Tax=Pseudoxanthomonas sp. UTMC 1351 TaxID=2695853 RepID=UPI0034CE276E